MVNVVHVATSIAVELGKEWRAEPGYMADASDAYLQGPEDIRIRIGTDHHKKSGNNRLFLSEAVTGDLRRFVRSGLMISVSRDRTSRDVAAELRRRLLPNVMEALGKARVDKAESDARDAEHAAMRETMSVALDGRTHSHDQNNVHFGSYGDGVSGSVEVRKFGGDVKFEVKVPKALAPAMADTVAALSKSDVPAPVEPAARPDTSPEPAPREPESPDTAAKGQKGRRKRLTPEERQDRVDALTGKLEAGIAEMVDGERWTAFLRTAQGFGASWSFNNLMLITLQAAERGFTPSMVKTFEAWKRLGRHPKTGEKALYIFEPIKYRLSVEEALEEGPGGFDSDGKPRMTIRGVRPSPRFDISQTEGEQAPAGAGAQVLATDEEIAGAWEAVAAQIRATGYNVVGGPPGRVDSYTDPASREVWVCDTLDDTAAALAALHELAHILLNHVDDAKEYRLHRGQLEAQAQSVALLAAGAIGLDTASYDRIDVASWAHGNTDLFAEAAERVTSTAHQIIRAVQESNSDE
ncbi:hypothetical protein SAMN04489732_13612 [Amycolatopsis saalfeldensis]|uniref:N-terminal domain-containing protein n=2 Tax=Amycolatopsis saalfeldensis TaxID=394193 RepID=A0A1H8YPB4_9PSEU|nr:hypothetical protein SAMN04489732_13612 [Amycolatopsis saalfeldensis]